MVTQNGSVLGLVDGLDRGVMTSGIEFGREVKTCMGNPLNVMTSPVISGLAFDVSNIELYMATVATGSTWIHLGSVS